MSGTTGYGVDRGIYNAAIYDAMNREGADVRWYLDLARRAPGPVLELCCGTGRITIPLARAGVRIEGVDMTAEMLNAAKRKAAAEELDIPWHLQDMRRLRLGRRKFGMIFIPFNSLQNTYTLDDLEKVFAGVRNHLAPGGLFAFDLFNPNIHFMVRGEKLKRDHYAFRLKDGRQVRISEVCRYDAAGQVNR